MKNCIICGYPAFSMDTDCFCTFCHEVWRLSKVVPEKLLALLDGFDPYRYSRMSMPERKNYSQLYFVAKGKKPPLYLVPKTHTSYKTPSKLDFNTEIFANMEKHTKHNAKILMVDGYEKNVTKHLMQSKVDFSRGCDVVDDSIEIEFTETEIKRDFRFTRAGFGSMIKEGAKYSGVIFDSGRTFRVYEPIVRAVFETPNFLDKKSVCVFGFVTRHDDSNHETVKKCISEVVRKVGMEVDFIGNITGPRLGLSHVYNSYSVGAVCKK